MGERRSLRLCGPDKYYLWVKSQVVLGGSALNGARPGTPRSWGS